jgi:hypothetical protein
MHTKMKPKITHEDVAKAYAELKEAGQDPSALTIRKKLGNRGSLETIQNILEKLRNGQNQAIDSRASAAAFESDMNAAVQRGVARAGAEIKRQAEEIRELQDKVSGLFAIEELLTEQFNEASAKVTAATDRERSLLAELSEARRQSTDSAMRLVDIAQVHHGELALVRAQLEEANARAHRHELRAQQLERKAR